MSETERDRLTRLEQSGSLESEVHTRSTTLGRLVMLYRSSMALLVILTLVNSALALAIPLIIAHAIDAVTAGELDVMRTWVALAVALALSALLTGHLLNIAQNVTAERVARDLRARLIDCISRQSYATIQTFTPESLLTNFTSDVDSIKLFVAQSFLALVSSIFTLLTAGGFLLWLDWQLALAVLIILPIIGASFYFGMQQLRNLFARMQAQVDALNKVLNENIVGAALIRLLGTGAQERDRFDETSGEVRALGLMILRVYAVHVPFAVFICNLATLGVLVFGGYYVIEDRMTLGEFTAFNAYLGMLIFPIFVISFAAMGIGQAQASHFRVSAVLAAPLLAKQGTQTSQLTGAVEVCNLHLAYGDRRVLNNVSFRIGAGTRTAIVGPTAAGKSQLLYVMSGLLPASSGAVLYDCEPIEHYSHESFYRQVGLVFQDSKLFHLTLRENIAFNADKDDGRLHLAIETAELRDFIATLPRGLDTVVSERGLSLSGGQKQRIMLARALTLEPKVLFLDDFTARIDVATETKILANVRRNYPDLTLVFITQKIKPVHDYDQIILVMDGEIIASGTHDSLVHSSPEYVQILRSQESTPQQEAM